MAPTTSQQEVEPDQVAGLRRAWTLAFVVGELVGFMPPALIGVVLATNGAPDVVMIVGLTVAGLFEGGAIGVAQAKVLVRFAPRIDSRAWVGATVVAAGAAWFIGMSGSAVGQVEFAPAPLVALVMIPASVAAVSSMGFLQWRVLRRVVPDSVRWVWVTTAAWMAGVTIPVAALSLVPNGWPAAAHVVVGVTAAIAMGLTVGFLTGRTLGRLLASDRVCL